MTGTMQNDAPATEKQEGTEELLVAVDQAADPESTDTEEQLEETEPDPQELKQKLEQAERERDHWKSVNDKQGTELGRLRKLENTLLEYDQKAKELESQESDHEYDTDKLATIRAQKLNIQDKASATRSEYLQLQTMQMIPDLQELIDGGYIASELKDIASAHNIKDFDMSKAINGVKQDSSKAFMIANAARRAKQIAELSDKSQKLKRSTNNLTEKVTKATESGIVSNGAQGKKTLTTADIRSLSDEEVKERLRIAKQKGLFNKK